MRGIYEFRFTIDARKINLQTQNAPREIAGRFLFCVKEIPAYLRSPILTQKRAVKFDYTIERSPNKIIFYVIPSDPTCSCRIIKIHNGNVW